MRKQALPHFRTAALIEDNQKAINSPNYRYRMSAETLEMVRSLEGHKADAAIKRFAPNAEPLSVGDTIEKDLVKNIKKLKELGFEITLHDKMPDVVLYREDKNWIYFIEFVTSVGAMDSKRIIELSEMSKNVTAGKIYVTAFQSFTVFKKFSDSLEWETEVWIFDLPDYMIHLNGDRFMGPRE